MGCIGKAFWGLIGIGLCGMYVVFCVMHGGWKYCALVLGSTAIAIVLIMISKLIMKLIRKNPVFTGKKAAKLEEARQLDESNALKNQTNKSKIDAEWQSNTERRAKEIDAMLPSLQAELADIQRQLDEKVAEIDENDCLGEDEKSIQIIQMLIYFIESRRADSIKEALHEYDKALANKQMVELEQKRLDMQKAQMEREASDRKKLLALQEEANDRARWAAMDNARQRDQMIEKLSSIQSVALTEYYKNL